MAEINNSILLPDEAIMQKIYFIRNQKVMLDRDLAELYGVETKRLKEQVKRNMERFPKHYMFELTIEEATVSRSQIATLKRGDNIKYLPLAFTEQEVMMLANVLKSKRAIEVSIKIIDVFILLRETLSNHTDLRLEIEYIKKKVSNHDKNIELVFQYLDELLEKKENKKERPQIGYKLPKKK
jgi:phage regulator Rha-like protein